MTIVLTIIIVMSLWLIHEWWQSLEFDGDVSAKAIKRSVKR